MIQRLQAGDRFRDMRGDEGVVLCRCAGLEICVRYDDGREVTTFEGMFEKIRMPLETSER